MKKTLFLMVAAMVILITGCAGSGHGFLRAAGGDNALANPPLPTSFKNLADRGIRLCISRRCSLNIDVEDILDYVQGEPTVITQSLRDDFMTPWIRWNIAF
jgi:hypothetical protein